MTWSHQITTRLESRSEPQLKHSSQRSRGPQNPAIAKPWSPDLTNVPERRCIEHVLCTLLCFGYVLRNQIDRGRLEKDVFDSFCFLYICVSIEIDEFYVYGFDWMILYICVSIKIDVLIQLKSMCFSCTDLINVLRQFLFRLKFMCVFDSFFVYMFVSSKIDVILLYVFDWFFMWLIYFGG